MGPLASSSSSRGALASIAASGGVVRFLILVGGRERGIRTEKGRRMRGKIGEETYFVA
jgi:hypothetical protein